MVTLAQKTSLATYSFSYASFETDMTTFYNELSSLVWHIPKHNVLIIGGNINAQIFKERNKNILLTLRVQHKRWIPSFLLGAYLQHVAKKKKK